MITCNCQQKSDLPNFTGRVDSSVNKYVKILKKESKHIYISNCEKNGRKINPVAFRVIDERCDTALGKLFAKAAVLHKDTVIKVAQNPNKSDKGLYLVAENKGLLREWEQKGAVDTVSVYRNNLKDVDNYRIAEYDGYITKFEGLVNNLNPKTLDKKMVRTSISNLWHLSLPKLLKKNYAEKYTQSTQKVARDIKYPNTTFGDSLREHFKSARAVWAPPKQEKNSIIDIIKELFAGKKEEPFINKIIEV